MAERIEVTIGPDGSISVQAVGFKGKGCEDATRAIEEALGQVSRRTKKTDYWQTEGDKHTNRQAGG
jgi:hypothetical protein